MVVAMIMVAVVAGATGLGAWALVDRVRAEWTCTCGAHEVRLVARQNTASLYVDGRRVARKTTLSGSGATLTWRVDADGSPVVLTATVVYPDGGAPTGSIQADGQWIGGARGLPAVQDTRAPEPTDARWAAAKLLLRDLRAARDARHGEAAQRIEVGLRDVLGKHDRLASAREAHKALGGDDSRIEQARCRLDDQATELLDALREFHLLALAEGGTPSLDRLDDLLAHLAAEAEVEAPGRPRARAGAAEG